MQKGFTLIETIIVIGMVAVLGLVLVEFYMGQNQSYRQQVADLDLNYSGRLALDEIDAHIREASQVLGAYDVYTAGPDVLILQVQSINSASQLIPGIYDHVIIYQNGGEVVRVLEPDATSSREPQTKQLATNVDSITFTYNNLDYAQVTEIETALSMSKDVGRDVRRLDIASKALLRN